MNSVAEYEPASPTFRSSLPEATLDIWKWIAGTMFGLCLFFGGYACRGGITRAEAVEIVTGPSNPYVADKATLQLEQTNSKENAAQMRTDLRDIKSQLVRLSIAMGVDPGEGGDAPRRRKSNHE